jgi:dienelactone hydrolase
MAEFEITSLTIAGYADLPLPNRFFRVSQPSQAHPKTLAVILPGLNYSCDMPLLYYPAKLLMGRGADVLQVHSDYTISIFRSANRQNQAVWLATDALAALRAGRSQDDYSQLVLVGKSIGSLALASLVRSELGLAAAAVWLTPLLAQPHLVEAATNSRLPGLFVASRNDPTFDAGALDRIKERTPAETLLFDGANHSLEIPGDALQSLDILRQVLESLQSFLDQHLG